MKQTIKFGKARAIRRGWMENAGRYGTTRAFSVDRLIIRAGVARVRSL